MHKIIIVDDEQIVRLAFKALVDWESHDFSVEFEASNGKQALKLIHEHRDISIVVTDINMPIMDGLELIASINLMEGNKPFIVVLSAYSDYLLVKKAFKMGVNDYILKTEMQPQNMLEVLMHCIKNSEVQAKDESDKGNRPSNNNREVLKENFLKGLLNNPMSNELWVKRKDLSVRLGERNFIVCFLWVDDYAKIIERYQNNSLSLFILAVNKSIYQVLNDFNMGELLCLSPQEYVIIASQDETSMSVMREKIINIVTQIKNVLTNYVNITVSISISRIRDEYREISKLFCEAESNVKVRFLLGKGRIILPEDVLLITGKIQESIIGNSGNFLNALKECDLKKMELETERLFELIKRSASFDIRKNYSYYMEIIYLLVSYIHETGEETEDVFGKEVDFYETITKFETMEEINIWLKNMIQWIIMYMKDKKDFKNTRWITLAQNFIKSNYKEIGRAHV